MNIKLRTRPEKILTFQTNKQKKKTESERLPKFQSSDKNKTTMNIFTSTKRVIAYSTA